MDWLIYKIRDILYEKIGEEKGYKITEYIYAILAFALLILVGYFTNTIWHTIIFFIVMNNIRLFTSGYHLTSLNYCTLITTLIFQLFAYFANKSIGTSLWVIFMLISLYTIRTISIGAPFTETDFENKSKLWHKNMATITVLIYIILAFILIIFDYELWANCILLGIIMTDVTMFVNPRGEVYE